MSIDRDIVNAVEAGDVPVLRALLDAHPDKLHARLYGSRYNGCIFHLAATCGQIEIMAYLADEREYDVHAISCGWTALSYARAAKSYKSAAWLLSRGADPKLKNSDDNDTVAFCASKEVQEALKEFNPAYVAQKRQEKIDGVWTKTGDMEVQHSYELLDAGLKLTDVFNFQHRIFRAYVRTREGGLSQSIVSFNDIYSSPLLEEALAHLQKQKGKATKEDIRSPRLFK